MHKEEPKIILERLAECVPVEWKDQELYLRGIKSGLEDIEIYRAKGVLRERNAAKELINDFYNNPMLIDVGAYLYSISSGGFLTKELAVQRYINFCRCYEDISEKDKSTLNYQFLFMALFSSSVEDESSRDTALQLFGIEDDGYMYVGDDNEVSPDLF